MFCKESTSKLSYSYLFEFKINLLQQLQQQQQNVFEIDNFKISTRHHNTLLFNSSSLLLSSSTSTSYSAPSQIHFIKGLKFVKVELNSSVTSPEYQSCNTQNTKCNTQNSKCNTQGTNRVIHTIPSLLLF